MKIIGIYCSACDRARAVIAIQGAWSRLNLTAASAGHCSLDQLPSPALSTAAAITCCRWCPDLFGSADKVKHQLSLLQPAVVIGAALRLCSYIDLTGCMRTQMGSSTCTAAATTLCWASCSAWTWGLWSGASWGLWAGCLQCSRHAEICSTLDMCLAHCFGLHRPSVLASGILPSPCIASPLHDSGLRSRKCASCKQESWSHELAAARCLLPAVSCWT